MGPGFPNVAVTKRTLPAGVYLSSSKGNYELLTNKPGKLDVTLAFAAKHLNGDTKVLAVKKNGELLL